MEPMSKEEQVNEMEVNKNNNKKSIEICDSLTVSHMCFFSVLLHQQKRKSRLKRTQTRNKSRTLAPNQINEKEKKKTIIRRSY